MKLAAFAFAAYAGLIATTIVAIVFYNPSSGDVSFLVELAAIGGGLIVWASGCAYALNKSKGLVCSLLFVGFLTMMVVMGLSQYGTLQNEEIHPVLNALRALHGISLIWLWVVLFRVRAIRRSDTKEEEEERRAGV